MPHLMAIMLVDPATGRVLGRGSASSELTSPERYLLSSYDVADRPALRGDTPAS
ncbi:MAG: hypothetical protein HKP61_23405 [Dactylosporangium sp.]|nr:hypothetical protein [Dactylosporangium sp.]NNJ63827.1 hypothetical protein [Dactylosporangium sp.]